MTVSINGTSGLIFNDASTQNTSAFTGGFAFRNRIINGAMMIDQRNAGAAVTTSAYTVDRFYCLQTGSTATFSVQQSTTVPTGFKNSLAFSVTAADGTLDATDRTVIYQAIEGLNCADLGWGAAGAATVTLSFLVRSSLTGTFGGAIRNGGGTRSYPFTYTISAANTWTTVSVTVAGDTTGTWATDNTSGIVISFGLGCGTTFSGSAGSWSGGNYFSATGAVSLTQTNSSNFYITGVQLEKGSTATSFDYRPYGTELALCQRYYYKIAPGSNPIFGTGQCYTSTGVLIYIPFKATMRTAPTALEQSGTAADYRVLNSGGSGVTCSSAPVFSSASIESAAVSFTVASGIVAGNASFGLPLTSAAYLAWSAEL
jgi:hypothetical protein